MDILEEYIWYIRMNSSIQKKERVRDFDKVLNTEPVPMEDCRPYMNTWLQCIDTKDKCCGKNKCKSFFREWQNCHEYNDSVRKYNRITFSGEDGTFNGLSSK